MEKVINELETGISQVTEFIESIPTQRESLKEQYDEQIENLESRLEEALKIKTSYEQALEVLKAANAE